MFQTVLDHELTDVVEVVLQPEVSFLALSFSVVLVEFLVDTLANATVDQYGSLCLVCGYRSKVIQPNVNTCYAFCFTFRLFGLFVLNVYDKAKSLRCQDHLSVLSLAVDTKAVVSWRDSFRLCLLFVLSSFDGFVIEDDLCQFVFVVRWFRSFDELGWVFLVGVECLLEVRPVG